MNSKDRWHFGWNKYRSAFEFKRGGHIFIQVWRFRAWKWVGAVRGNGEQA